MQLGNVTIKKQGKCNYQTGQQLHGTNLWAKEQDEDTQMSSVCGLNRLNHAK